jgi:hypothetical protein
MLHAICRKVSNSDLSINYYSLAAKIKVSQNFDLQQNTASVIDRSFGEQREGHNMKKLLIIVLTLAMTLTAFQITNSSALAEEGKMTRGPLLAALSTPGGSCGQAGAAGSTGLSVLACRSSGYASNKQLMAAVSCGSNQWCCKHDFSNGTCVRCCSK